jgi:hypothetical protein
MRIWVFHLNERDQSSETQSARSTWATIRDDWNLETIDDESTTIPRSPNDGKNMSIDDEAKERIRSRS